MIGPSGELADVIALRPRQLRAVIIAKTGAAAHQFADRHNIKHWNAVRSLSECQGLDRIGEIYRADQVPEDVRKITAELNLRRAMQRPDEYRAPAPHPAVAEARIRAVAEHRTIIAGTIDEVRAHLDALPAQTVVRALDSGVVYEARDWSGNRVWFTPGSEVEDTTQYVTEHEGCHTPDPHNSGVWIGGRFAVLFVPERTQADTQAAA